MGAAKGSMKTSRPVDARLLADGEDPGLQSELGGEYTRLYGGCHEHAARFDPVYWIGVTVMTTVDVTSPPALGLKSARDLCLGTRAGPGAR